MTSLRQSRLTWLWCAAGCPAPATTAMSALVPGATPPSSTVTPGPQEDQDLDQSEVIIQCHVTSSPPITAHLGTSTVAELKCSGSCTAVCSAAEACSSSSCTHGL